MSEMLEFRLMGIAALAALLGLALSVAQPPEFDPGPFATIALPAGRSIEIGRFEVTQAQWQACYRAEACTFLPKNPAGGAKGAVPVTGVNAFDVAEYLVWVNSSGTGRYHLPTADEWAYLSGGLSRRETVKLFDDPRLAWAADYGSMEAVSPLVRPSGAFGTSASGIADLAGNVWEWTGTCVAVTSAEHLCPAFIASGLHEAKVSPFVRDPLTGGCSAGTPPANLGFRLVREG